MQKMILLGGLPLLQCLKYVDSTSVHRMDQRTGSAFLNFPHSGPKILLHFNPKSILQRKWKEHKTKNSLGLEKQQNGHGKIPSLCVYMYACIKHLFCLSSWTTKESRWLTVTISKQCICQSAVAVASSANLLCMAASCKDVA